MSERRFTEKPDLNPGAVMALDDNHPAMLENRTLFPSTVVTVTADAPDRLLVSGRNNRKIGGTVEKGKFKGYGIFCLSLEERATCPTDCEARGICYGNGMQMARRHRIGDADVFFDRLALEICELLDEHPGLLIRLHVLGDFPSVEYVSFWKEVLDEHPNVACFGYTHRSPLSWGGDDIGEAIQAVKDAQPDRFRIRWSSPVARPDGAVIVKAVPAGPRDVNNSLVCPSQTQATACCATCGLCWEASAKRECIAFIKHGRMSIEAEAVSVMADAVPTSDRRPIQAIPIAGLSPSAIRVARPTFIDVDPRLLIVETKYQRDLSGKSMHLIRRIIEKFDWTKFKPPVCVADGDGYFVIDGQHTAIGAASHPDIETIPIMLVDAGTIEARASSFVAHNRDRVAMSPYQVFHGEVTAISTIRDLYATKGEAGLRKVIKAAVEAKCRPINATVVRALDSIFFQPQYEGVDRDDVVTALLMRSDLEQAAFRFAGETNQGRYTPAAVILYRAASALSGRKAA